MKDYSQTRVGVVAVIARDASVLRSTACKSHRMRWTDSVSWRSLTCRELGVGKRSSGAGVREFRVG